jgi:hypothetical protein
MVGKQSSKTYQMAQVWSPVRRAILVDLKWAMRAYRVARDGVFLEFGSVIRHELVLVSHCTYHCTPLTAPPVPDDLAFCHDFVRAFHCMTCPPLPI